MNTGNRTERLRSLCREYMPRLRTYIEMNFPVVSEETDDIVQDILEKAVSRFHRYNPAYSITTWMYTIARNHCIDLLRRHERRAPFACTSPPEDFLSHHPGPEEAVIQRSETDRMRKLIRRLPDTERQVLFLSAYEGLSFRDIAGIMGIPEGTAKYLKHKAKASLAAMWEENS